MTYTLSSFKTLCYAMGAGTTFGFGAWIFNLDRIEHPTEDLIPTDIPTQKRIDVIAQRMGFNDHLTSYRNLSNDPFDNYPFPIDNYCMSQYPFSKNCIVLSPISYDLFNARDFFIAREVSHLKNHDPLKKIVFLATSPFISICVGAYLLKTRGLKVGLATGISTFSFYTPFGFAYLSRRLEKRADLDACKYVEMCAVSAGIVMLSLENQRQRIDNLQQLATMKTPSYIMSRFTAMLSLYPPDKTRIDYLKQCSYDLTKESLPPIKLILYDVTVEKTTIFSPEQSKIVSEMIKNTKKENKIFELDTVRINLSSIEFESVILSECTVFERLGETEDGAVLLRFVETGEGFEDLCKVLDKRIFSRPDKFLIRQNINENTPEKLINRLRSRAKDYDLDLDNYKVCTFDDEFTIILTNKIL